MRTKFIYKNHRGDIEERDVDIVEVRFDHMLHPELGYNTPGWYVCGWDYSRERNGKEYRSFVMTNIVIPSPVIALQYNLLKLPQTFVKEWDEKLEARAKEIFEAMPYDGPGAVGAKPAWVEHGNSLKQDEARRRAMAERVNG